APAEERAHDFHQLVVVTAGDVETHGLARGLDRNILPPLGTRGRPDDRRGLQCRRGLCGPGVRALGTLSARSPAPSGSDMPTSFDVAIASRIFSPPIFNPRSR